MEFHDFQIRAWTVDRERASVLVHSSPAGGTPRPETVVLNWERLGAFRKIFQSPSEVTPLQLTAGGRELATVVLPERVLSLLIRSLERVGPEDGLRVRLCLDGSLSDLPWEYLILPDRADMKSPGSFIALDARVSLDDDRRLLPLEFVDGSDPHFWQSNRQIRYLRVIGRYDQDIVFD